MSLNPKILAIMKRDISELNYYHFFEDILYRESGREELGEDRRKITRFYKSKISEYVDGSYNQKITDESDN